MMVTKHSSIESSSPKMGNEWVWVQSPTAGVRSRPLKARPVAWFNFGFEIQNKNVERKMGNNNL